MSDCEYTCEDCIYFFAPFVEDPNFCVCLANHTDHVDFDKEPCEMFQDGDRSINEASRKLHTLL